MHTYTSDTHTRPSKCRWRRAAVVLAAAVLLPLASFTAPASAQAESDDNGADSEFALVDVIRLGGQDRYETSLAIAKRYASGADSVSTVVMASGVDWTDSVVAAGLAGSLDAPMLLTPPKQLRDDALEFLNEEGVERVVVVSAAPPGRDPTVRAAVTDALVDAGFMVERVSGEDQYRTGVAAARELGNPGTLGSLGRTAIIASGEVFADALVSGSLAARNSIPVLLTPKAGLHADVAGYLTDAGVSRVVLMGGTAALSAEVQSAVENLGITVDRIAGASRFDTATLFAAYAATHSDGCFEGDSIGLARARIPFDSLGAAPLLAQQCAPLVLTNPTQMPAPTETFIDAARSGREQMTLWVFGGQAAVSSQMLESFGTPTEAPTPTSVCWEGTLNEDGEVESCTGWFDLPEKPDGKGVVCKALVTELNGNQHCAEWGVQRWIFGDHVFEQIGPCWDQFADYKKGSAAAVKATARKFRIFESTPLDGALRYATAPEWAAMHRQAEAALSEMETLLDECSGDLPEVVSESLGREAEWLRRWVNWELDYAAYKAGFYCRGQPSMKLDWAPASPLCDPADFHYGDGSDLFAAHDAVQN